MDTFKQSSARRPEVLRGHSIHNNCGHGQFSPKSDAIRRRRERLILRCRESCRLNCRRGDPRHGVSFRRSRHGRAGGYSYDGACDRRPNSHIHEMTLRRVEGEASRAESEGLECDVFGRAQQVRTEMAARLNEFCRRHDIDYHADPRSNAARGLPEPELTLPSWNILLAKRTGEPTPWMEENEAHRAGGGGFQSSRRNCCRPKT